MIELRHVEVFVSARFVDRIVGGIVEQIVIDLAVIHGDVEPFVWDSLECRYHGPWLSVHQPRYWNLLFAFSLVPGIKCLHSGKINGEGYILNLNRCVNTVIAK